MNNVRLTTNFTTWRSNFVSCMEPSPEGQVLGTGGALFMDAVGFLVATNDTFEGNGVVRCTCLIVCRVAWGVLHLSTDFTQIES